MNRTRKQWERYCEDYIRERDNVFSIFWATENKFRANAMSRICKRVKTKKLGFPFTKIIWSKK